VIIPGADWIRALTQAGVRLSTAAHWYQPFVQQVQPDLFSAGMKDVVDFVGQILHESAMLERLEEDLNYSAGRMLQVWPRRFPGGLAEAQLYAFRPIELANKVYGGRMGNNQPGDGWLHRGRGLIMLTGKANYQAVQGITGIPIADNPDMLTEPDIAMQVAIAWWEKKIPDDALGDIERVTEDVNGGLVGIDHRLALTNAMKDYFT
jgi:putative chitinase